MSEMNEKVEEPREPAADRAPMPDEELQKILEAHRKWVESEEKDGKMAGLYRANLQGAFLYGTTGFTASQVKAAKNWELAFYSDDFLKELGLPPDHNEWVKTKLAELEKGEKGTGGK